jgi:type II secretory ATPase GspE/PulE/Tfp pilus assembly ATPase PilB-like protein
MGKTTAVYSALLRARGEGRDVILNGDELAEAPDAVPTLVRAGISVAPVADLRSAPAEAVIAMGDIRRDRVAIETIRLAETHLVVAVLRIGASSCAFTRLVDTGADPAGVAEVSLVSFGQRLIPGANQGIPVHEELVVSDFIRQLVRARASSQEVGRQAAREGMRLLRERALEQVGAGRISLRAALEFTPDFPMHY